MSTTTNASSPNSLITNNATTSATTRGTKIVKPGSDMNKNAFLKILVAEVSNQDPTSNKDSTAYVTQMAQFATMEQMNNLNNTMAGYASNALIGKSVITNVADSKGLPYAGVIRTVSNTSGNIVYGIEVSKSDGSGTELQAFNQNEIVTVSETSDYNLENLSTNTAFLATTNMIGKKGEFDVKDSSGNNLVGLVKGVLKENGVLKLRVQEESTGDIKTVSLSNIVKLDMI